MGLARLATRLCNERLDAIRDPDRAARFVQAAAGFFARHGIAPDWRWDPYLDPLRSLALTGTPPVLLRVTQPSPLQPTKDQPLAPCLFRMAGPDTPAPPGGVVVNLHSARPVDMANLARFADHLLRSDTAAVLFALGDAPLPQPPAGLSSEHATVPDFAAIRDLGSRDHVLAVKSGDSLPPDRDDPDLGLLDQALHLAQREAKVLWVKAPLAARLDLPPVSGAARLAGLDRLAQRPAARHLPAGWDRRLYLQIAAAEILRLQQDPNQFRRRLRLLWPLMRLWWLSRQRGWIGTAGQVDSPCPRIIRRILRLPPSG